jgi:hypothetical protein
MSFLPPTRVLLQSGPPSLVEVDLALGTFENLQPRFISWNKQLAIQPNQTLHLRFLHSTLPANGSLSVQEIALAQLLLSQVKVYIEVLEFVDLPNVSEMYEIIC